MSDEKKSGWDSFADQLKDPLDWGLFVLGCAGGSVVTAHVGGLDFGHSVLAGGLGAVGLRRAAAAGLLRSNLKKKAEALHGILQEDGRQRDLITGLGDNIVKWRNKILSNDDFDKCIEEISREDTARKMKNSATMPPKVMVTTERLIGNID